jgi:protein-disulfide isomerase
MEKIAGVAQRSVLVLALIGVTRCGSPARDTDSRAADSPTTSGRTASTESTSATPAAAANERSSRRVIVHGVDLTGVGYDKGRLDAPIVIVNFSDFGCPYCRGFALETEPAIEREYVATGKVFLKYVPFVVGPFPNGQQAARTAECAAEQGRFWPMHDRVYAHQKAWKDTLYALPVFQRDAAALNLDTARFTRCYSTNHLHPRSKEATDAADRLGIRITPSFFVNDRLVEGALPLLQFRELLDAALRDAR